MTTRDGVDPHRKADELRRLANAEYFDIMLLHWQHTALPERIFNEGEESVASSVVCPAIVPAAVIMV
jgi:hypothetical protein